MNVSTLKDKGQHWVIKLLKWATSQNSSACKTAHGYSTFNLSWQEVRMPTSGNCLPGRDYYEYNSGQCWCLTAVHMSQTVWYVHSHTCTATESWSTSELWSGIWPEEEGREGRWRDHKRSNAVDRGERPEPCTRNRKLEGGKGLLWHSLPTNTTNAFTISTLNHTYIITLLQQGAFLLA